jgi:hypothetical protein
VINMIRQTGPALGAAILVAALVVFRHGWWVTAAQSAASIVPAMTLLRERQ